MIRKIEENTNNVERIVEKLSSEFYKHISQDTNTSDETLDVLEKIILEMITTTEEFVRNDVSLPKYKEKLVLKSLSKLYPLVLTKFKELSLYW